jgi:hypothetical protein
MTAKQMVELVPRWRLLGTPAMSASGHVQVATRMKGGG